MGLKSGLLSLDFTGHYYLKAVFVGILEQLTDDLSKILLDSGVEESKVGALLGKFESTFQHHFSGESIYVKNCKSDKIRMRNLHIVAEFANGNYRELARKYDLSVRQIKEIVRDGSAML